jgi:SAM-dependent methyltransferase
MEYYSEPVCRICENKKGNSRFLVKEMLFGTRDVFQYFQCNECGCLQIVEMPKKIAKYYPEEYYSYSDFSSITNLKFNRFRYSLDIHANRWPIVASFVKLLRVLVKPSKHLVWAVNARLTCDSKVLDVGCGHGKILLKMSSGGFRNCLGIDPFIPADMIYPNGVKVLKLDLTEFSQSTTEKFDLIMFNHSLEHMEDPFFMISTAKRLLNPAGRILIRVPVADSHLWEHYREHWFGIDAPRHFYLFTKNSMKILAAKSGLSIERIDYDTTKSHFIEFELYKRDIPGNASSQDKNVFSKAQIRNYKKQMRILDKEKRGGQAAFYLVAQ